MRLILARHGESVGNVNRLFYGITDLELTDTGRAQAADLGRKLSKVHIDRCITSPLVRASETARIALAGRDVPIITDKRVIEQNMGDFENVSFDEMFRRYPDLITNMLADWSNNPPPNGESFDSVSKRVLEVLDEIIERDEDTLITAHNGSISALLVHLMHLNPSSVMEIWLMHGCYTSFVSSHGILKLEYFNK